MKPVPITFATFNETPDDVDAESAAAKLKARATKFGQSVTDDDIAKLAQSRKPGLLRDELRKERATRKDHISAGFDMYSEGEMDKQTQRAARFGTSAPAKGVAIAQVPEAELARKRRAEKFGLQYEEPDQAGIDKRIVLEQRQDTDGHSEPRPDTLHLYGVDLLTTHDLLAHFSAYNPTFVEWINDSCCNICFADDFTVKRVIIQLGEALTAQETADSGVMMLEDAAQPEVWHRCKTAITKSGVAVPLLFRVAVSSDAKNPLKQHKRRGLWKMPVRQALEVVQSGADVEDAGGAPEAPRPRGRGSVQGRRGKRSRLDDDGDVIMGGEDGGGGRRGRRKNGRQGRGGGDLYPDDAHPDAAGAVSTHFLHDDAREVVQPQGRQGLRSEAEGAEVKVEAAGGAAAPAAAGGGSLGGGVAVKEEEKVVQVGAVVVKDDPGDAAAMDVD